MAQERRQSGSLVFCNPLQHRGSSQPSGSGKLQSYQLPPSYKCAGLMPRSQIAPSDGVVMENGLLRNKIEDPAEHQADEHEFSKYFSAVDQSFFARVFGDCPKHSRGKDREHSHNEEMSQGFLPAAMSKASSIV